MQSNYIEMLCPCGKLIKVHPYKTKIQHAFYCSRKCMYSLRPKIASTCRTCGKHILSEPARIRKYCNRTCYEAQRPQRAKTPEQRFWEGVEKSTNANGCWQWMKSNNDGYGSIYMNGRSMPASHFSYILHVGPIPDGMWILHKCDNPPCVRPDHLFLGTVIENNKDRDAKGRTNHGENVHTAKLTDTDIPAIRDMLSQGKSQSDIARIYGVKRNTIQGIASGKTWRHIL